MSRQSRKQSQRKKRQEKHRQPEQSAYRLSWKIGIPTAVLALVAGTVFVAQLLDTRSMFSAIRRVEETRLFSLRDDDAASWRVPREPTWDDVRVAHNTALKTHPLLRKHESMARLLFLLVGVNRGEQDPVSAFAIATPLAEADPENLVTRLAFATLADIRAYDDSITAPSPEERFAHVRQIVESLRPAEQATLYNAEFADTWHGVVRGFIKRPDVAVSLAEAVGGYLIEDQYEALPIIRDRFAALAAALKESGHEQEAGQCVAWIARLTLGLIKADTDTGTRLLCAELLAQTLDEDSVAADGLRRLTRDYRAAVAAAPVDMADQSFSTRPAVDPDAYRAALRSLVVACVFGLAASGGAVVFVVAGLAAVFGAIVARGKRPHRLELKRSIYAVMLVALIPATAVAVIVVRWLAACGLHSQFWGYFVACCVIAAGALGAAALASWMIAPAAGTRWRVVVCGLLAAAATLVALAPPPAVTRMCRSFDLWAGFAWVLLPGVFVLGAAALFLCPARFRTMAMAAALLWCANSVAALTILQYHGAADKRYQQSVLQGRRDEITARLGANWQDTYLSAAREALNAGAS
ncbi:MAG: hypothetical protein ABII12_13465 [Planctomycetota bacterium]